MKTAEKKTALIMGGTSGNGKATAPAFAKEGANVVVFGPRVEEGEQAAREITSADGGALFVQTDLIRESDIIALIEKTLASFGSPHIAFNNAGVEGQIGALKTEQCDQICDVNIRLVLLSRKHEIPPMLRSGGGATVNNSVGHIGLPGASVYVSSKFAVIGLTKATALEFSKQGVRTNSVSPGPNKKAATALPVARGFRTLRKSWAQLHFCSETKPGRKRSATGLENQIPKSEIL